MIRKVSINTSSWSSGYLGVSQQAKLASVFVSAVPPPIARWLSTFSRQESYHGNSGEVKPNYGGVKEEAYKLSGYACLGSLLK